MNCVINLCSKWLVDAESYGKIQGFAVASDGNAYFLHQSPLNSLQAAYGLGVRWKSPFGPIAIDIARPINPRPNDKHTVFDFGAGAPL